MNELYMNSQNKFIQTKEQWIQSLEALADICGGRPESFDYLLSCGIYKKVKNETIDISLKPDFSRRKI